ncbi:hypothetical protein [Lentzea tibetensis]|nr:hypothetical protein [Lentzea tibetensis]
MKKFMTRAAALLGLMAMSTGMPAPTADVTAAPAPVISTNAAA